MIRAALSVPLTAKLVGANALVALAAVIVARQAGGATLLRADQLLIGALIAALVLNVLFVRVALQPLGSLVRTAQRVSLGDVAARVPSSPLADREVAHLGEVINVLLDRLDSDRQRMRQMAGQVISAGDAERARIARELHDSTAQTLAGIVLQSAAACRENADQALAPRLEEVHLLAGHALEEVRTLSHTVYPRVLDDLGLAAALEWLARRTREAQSLDIDVESSGNFNDLPRGVAAALYGVAQEAVRNVTRHAHAARARIVLARESNHVRLEIADDGTGFDVADAGERRPGMGLFTMRERVALFDGEVHIHAVAGAGTHVVASIPLRESKVA